MHYILICLSFGTNCSRSVGFEQALQVPDPGKEFPPLIGIPVEDTGLGSFDNVVDGQDIRIVPVSYTHLIDDGRSPE